MNIFYSWVWSLI